MGRHQIVLPNKPRGVPAANERDELAPFHPVELRQVPAVKARSQHIELAAISQPGAQRGVRCASVTGNIRAHRDFRVVPIPDLSRRSIGEGLLDNLVGEGE